MVKVIQLVRDRRPGQWQSVTLNPSLTTDGLCSQRTLPPSYLQPIISATSDHTSPCLSSVPLFILSKHSPQGMPARAGRMKEPTLACSSGPSAQKQSQSGWRDPEQRSEPRGGMRRSQSTVVGREEIQGSARGVVIGYGLANCPAGTAPQDGQVPPVPDPPCQALYQPYPSPWEPLATAARGSVTGGRSHPRRRPQRRRAAAAR